MKKDRLIWSSVLIVSFILLIGYGFWTTGVIRTGNNGYGYYGRGMMGQWFNGYDRRIEGRSKLSTEQIVDNVKKYLGDNDDDLKIADVFIYKDSDYYVSVVESDTGKGAAELLVNPYTGYIYPEYGPNMMWNEKYGMHGGGIYQGSAYRGIDSKNIGRDQALKASDDYVKKTEGKDYSVPDEGHEFYGYYTFHVNKGDEPVGMLSVNYSTGDIWYHTWHGQLEKVISNEEQEGVERP